MDESLSRFTKHRLGKYALMLIIGFVGWKAFRWVARDHWSNSSVITLVSGGTLSVEEAGSNWHYNEIIPHTFGIGGGGYEQTLKFSVDGKKYVWEGAYIPIVLQLDGSTPVLIVFDRVTNHSKCTFRYYRAGREWEEVPLSTFPPHLAMQNMWLSPREVLNPNDPHFRSSMLANLWFCIRNNRQYYEVENLEIDEEFLRQYQQAYFPDLK